MSRIVIQHVGDDMGECPCGAKIAVDMPGRSVMHALPMCDEFARRDVMSFLAYVREHREDNQQIADITKAYGVKA